MPLKSLGISDFHSLMMPQNQGHDHPQKKTNVSQQIGEELKDQIPEC
jgi:hypothetical protein